jgi:hypothetical protein
VTADIDEDSMSIEILLVVALIAAALFPVAKRLHHTAARVGLFAVFCATVAGVFWWQGVLRARDAARAAVAAKVPEQGRPGGYVSSDNCRSCHPQHYDSWHQSYHRTMTQLPSRETVRGDFENVTLEFQGEKFHLERDGDEYWVDMVDPDWRYVQTLKRAANQTISRAEELNPPRTRKRISMLTGSHRMQAYWIPSAHGNMQFSFPFTYLFHDQRWAPRNDVFLIDPSYPWIQQVWNVNCINCHATGGQPRQDPRTKVINSRTAELGISCESCHGPGEEHIRVNSDPTRRYSLHSSTNADRTIFNPSRHTHAKASAVCSQCHSIRRNIHKEQWNAEGIHYWPGEDIESKAPLIHYDNKDLNVRGNEKKKALMEGSFWSDGQVRISGRDYTGMAASGCFTRGELSCLSCHSMHNYQSTAHQLARHMDGNQACYQCHGDYAAKIEQHTHHRAGSSGSLCYNCHMPHTSYGLLKAIRSHTINSPTVQSSLDTGRPNACNLCHLDKSLDWTAIKLNAWYQQPKPALSPDQRDTSAALLWLLNGDAGQRSLIAWHFGWEPAQAASDHEWMPRYLAEGLIDPYSSVRYISQRSLKTLPGFQSFNYDYIGPIGQRTAARLHVIQSSQPSLSSTTNTALRLTAETISRLIERRDHRPMELLE